LGRADPGTWWSAGDASGPVTAAVVVPIEVPTRRLCGWWCQWHQLSAVSAAAVRVSVGSWESTGNPSPNQIGYYVIVVPGPLRVAGSLSNVPQHTRLARTTWTLDLTYHILQRHDLRSGRMQRSRDRERESTVCVRPPLHHTTPMTTPRNSRDFQKRNRPYRILHPSSVSLGTISSGHLSVRSIFFLSL
jgi:hypothetical protein